MKKIYLGIICIILSLGANEVYATDISECVRLTDGELYTHDLNTPYLDNCYIVKNNYKSSVSISLGFLDNLEGSLLVKKYSASTGQSNLIEDEYSGNGFISFYSDDSIGNDEYLIKVNDLTFPNRDKNISISKITEGDTIHIAISVRNVREESPTPPPPPGSGGGYCDPQTNICYEPLSEGINSFNTIQSNNQECSGRLRAPDGFNENYDILQEAENMRIFAEEIDSQPFVPESIKLMQKGLYFGLVMAPQSFYDLKTNEAWKSSADAGNYNYGYLGKAIGLDKKTLMNAAGLAQMATDELSKGGNYPFMDNLATGIWEQDYSQFDNIPEDPDQIEAGADAYESGCNPDTDSNSNTNAGSGSGGGGVSGWSPYSRLFIGGSRCIGNCDIPVGTVTITDLELE